MHLIRVRPEVVLGAVGQSCGDTAGRQQERRGDTVGIEQGHSGDRPGIERGPCGDTVGIERGQKGTQRGPGGASGASPPLTPGRARRGRHCPRVAAEAQGVTHGSVLLLSLNHKPNLHSSYFLKIAFTSVFTCAY